MYNRSQEGKIPEEIFILVKTLSLTKIFWILLRGYVHFRHIWNKNNDKLQWNLKSKTFGNDSKIIVEKIKNKRWTNVTLRSYETSTLHVNPSCPCSNMSLIGLYFNFTFGQVNLIFFFRKWWEDQLLKLPSCSNV